MKSVLKLFVAIALLCCADLAAAQQIRVVSSCAVGVSPTYAAGSDRAFLTVDTTGKLCSGTGGSGQFPAGSTAVTGNAQGTTGAVVGTLTAAAGKTTYICGFNVSAVGGTASTNPVVAGIAGSSQNYLMVSATAPQFLTQAFNPCLPASAVNTAITVTTTAAAGATAVNVNTWGYQQ